jgi:tetratricopeptide (TPR) repeat protein
MSKIGFLQDLLRGVQKVLDESKAAPKAQTSATDADTAPGIVSLHKRMTMFLENGEWKQAEEYANRILDIEPEHAQAYVGLLCVEVHAKDEKELPSSIARLNSEQGVWIDTNKNFTNAMRFADDAFRREIIYAVASEQMKNEYYMVAAEGFKKLSGYRDSEAKIAECENQEQKRLKNAYDKAVEIGKKAIRLKELGIATNAFGKLGDFLDSHEQKEKFEKRLDMREKIYAAIIWSLSFMGLIFLMYSMVKIRAS